VNEKDFRFKRFNLNQTEHVHKVGTDGVLLGAWSDFADSKRILDIGTGTGLIALMAAQKSNASIIGLDDDPHAIEVAGSNFSRSPWYSRLEAICCSLQQYETTGLFDHIVTNPPFFVKSLKPPNSRRSMQRHTDALPHDLLIDVQKKLLMPQGKFSIILPVFEAQQFQKKASTSGLHLNRLTQVTSKENGPCTRHLMEFSFYKSNHEPDFLIIQNYKSQFTSDYQKLTADFYLNF
jgi:tRNA1Val (adenine37-N6)-methyltransferase